MTVVISFRIPVSRFKGPVLQYTQVNPALWLITMLCDVLIDSERSFLLKVRWTIYFLFPL
jgi:hypothetical protein